MHRTRRLLVALAALTVTAGLTAGLAAAHVLPSASDNGIQQARDASGLNVPLSADPSAADRADQLGIHANQPTTDSHGATVSAAAQGDTPDGFDNHGAYVSSIAKGWGQQTSDTHRDGAGGTPPTAVPPAAATQGLSNKP